MIIPSDIEHINQGCFYNCKSLQQIEFLPDSKITSIGKDLFNCYNITIVNLPNSLILKGNTSFIQHLKDIVITPSNQNFKCFENIFLGKSNVNSDEFDTLAYAFRNVVSANIPSNIKYICPFCFNNCSTLQNVVFSNDSQLRSIGPYAFAKTSIETITIPPHVTEIGDCAFIECSKLRNVVFSNNSELRSIGPYAFFNTLISSITIPPHVTEIGDCAFNRCSRLQYINFTNDSELRSIGYYAFSQTSIETITIPPHVTEIGYCAFRECSKLRNVVFSNNSELRSIGYEAFFGTSIETITIPPHVTVIDGDVFNRCSKLRNASFPNNSELRTIGRLANNNQIPITLYSETDGKILFNASKNASQVIIPSNIKNICSDFFINAQNLTSVVIPNNSEIRSIGPYAFSNTSISSITIPSHVTEIGDYAFSRCSRLQNINFSNDSELRSIGPYAFSNSSIETITIPPHVTEICDGAFSHCSKLQNIVISYNSELRSIGRFALECENVKNIRIPPHLTMYGEGNLNNTYCNYEICGISTIFSIGRNIVGGSYSTFQIFPSPDDGCYKWIDESILLGKSSENEDDYDILVYANPFIEQVTIPANSNMLNFCQIQNSFQLENMHFDPLQLKRSQFHHMLLKLMKVHFLTVQNF